MTQIVATSHYHLASMQTEHSSTPIDALIPHDVDHLPLKAVGAQLASLWALLESPHELSTLSTAAQRAVIPFLHDGVFGLLDRDEITTGPAALEQMAGAHDVVPRSPTADVSMRAIEMASHLPPTTPLEDVASFLYRHGSTPATHENYDEGLSLAPMHLDWCSPVEATAEETGWLMFWPRSRPNTHSHKLYVGVHPRDRREVVAAVAHTLSTLGPKPFKVGFGRNGTIRPDSIVIYVESAAAAERNAHAIAEAVPDVERRPVPFSVDLTGDGLVSGGMDDAPTGEYSELPTSSWRVEMCTAVGAAILSSHAFTPTSAGVTVDVLRRLTFDGIDPRTWQPNSWTTNNQEDQI